MTPSTLFSLAVSIALLTFVFAQDEPQSPAAPVAQSSASGSNGFGFGTGAPGTGGGGGFGANGGAGSGGGAGTTLGGSGGGVGVSDGSSATGSGCTTGSCGGGAALGGGPLGTASGSSEGSNGFGFGSGAPGTGGGGGFGANGGGGSGGGAGNQLGGTGGGAGASNGSIANGSGATNSSTGGGVVTGKGVAPLPLTTSPPTEDAQASETAPEVEEEALSDPLSTSSLAADASSPSTQSPAQSQTPPVPNPTPRVAPIAVKTPSAQPSTTATYKGSEDTNKKPMITAEVPVTKTPVPLITAMVPVANSGSSNGNVASKSYSGDVPIPSAVPTTSKQGDVLIVDMAKPNEKKEVNCTTEQLPKVVVEPSHDESKCYIKKERCCPVEYGCGFDCHNKWFKVCKSKGECDWFNEKKCYPKICVEDKCVLLGRIEGPSWTPTPAPTVHWNVVVTKIEN